ncbi:tRNA-splicing endonuclease subunit sen54 n-term domain-containing protein [Phthorimaea operculella]|nr:tRNA-splicing endonuclease subunit sen54 n-term domain-containing protein [Phthorimaea operculella]
MDKSKLLSGAELVARGITKIDVTLPALGQKEVVPSGTWLEQKQIQSALEARKHMIEVQRIEKSSVLSQAEWREDLMLAEVSKKVGGHWQYVGHNVGKTTYLTPEEALYLMEVNCLRLTYNGVIVSLQQAYSLLLRGDISILHYKVYASLSRIGYKVFRHDEKNDKIITESENEVTQAENQNKEIPIENEVEMKEVGDAKENNMEMDSTQNEIACNENNDCDKQVPECPKEDIVVNQEENKVAVEDASNDKSNQFDKEQEIVTECPKTDIIVNSNEHEKAVDDASNGNSIDKSNDCDKELNVTECPKDIGNKEENKMVLDDTCNEDCTSKEDIAKSQGETVLEKESKLEEGNSNETNTDEVEVNGISIDNNTEETNEDCDKANQDINSNSDETNNIGTKEENMITEITSAEDENNVKATENVVKENEFNNILESTYNDIEMKNLDENTESKEKEISNNKYDSVVSSSQNQNRISLVLNNTKSETYHQYKIKNLENRKLRPLDMKNTDKYFEKVPDLYQNQIVTVNVPEEDFIPRNVFLNNISYTLNIESIKSSTKGPNRSNTSRAFSTNEHVSGDHIKRIKAATSRNIPSNDQRSESTQSRKRRVSAKQRETHLQAIKNLAQRLKELIQTGATQQDNIISLQRLINTFNIKYSMRLRLTEDFELFNNETIVDTIELDEDDEPSSKKAKSNDDKYKENLNSLKQLALKLKGLETKQQVTSKHKRAFSNLIKKFNKSYNADIYVNSNFEIIDRKLISLDSSSDSDCVIEESTKATGSKKLKNPFNILKRLSEKRNVTTTTNAKDGTKVDEKSNNYSSTTIECFSKDWLPSEADFGRAEVVPKTFMYSYLLHSKREEYIYEFIKSQPYEFENWMDIKLTFLKSIEETDNTMEIDATDATAVNALVEPEDCADMPTVLKKLSIISTNKEVAKESSLKIHFDVYNRDVQNFKKTNPPAPHFRVVCISESSSLPSRKDVASLHSKNDENVTIVFAVVGIDSVSYLQINPFDLPTYIPCSDLE